jgi:hypothetical protein
VVLVVVVVVVVLVAVVVVVVVAVVVVVVIALANRALKFAAGTTGEVMLNAPPRIMMGSTAPTGTSLWMVLEVTLHRSAENDENACPSNASAPPSASNVPAPFRFGI